MSRSNVLSGVMLTLDLVTFRAVSKSMRQLVAIRTTKLDMLLFRTRVVDLDTIKACVSGKPQRYNELQSRGPVLELHPFVDDWEISTKGKEPYRIVTEMKLENPYKKVKMSVYPSIIKENCLHHPSTTFTSAGRQARTGCAARSRHRCQRSGPRAAAASALASRAFTLVTFVARQWTSAAQSSRRRRGDATC